MKNDWRKDEKTLYQTQEGVYQLSVPELEFLTLRGDGSPRSKSFQDDVKTLFSLAYTLKFGIRKGLEVEGFRDYAVYPLEGVWDICETAKARGNFTAEDYVYTLMIRQPAFFTQDHLAWAITQAKKKDPTLSYEAVRYETLSEGDCVQTLHIGPFATESESFARLDAYLKDHDLRRKTGAHREIYLSVFTKTAPEALKTILRVQVGKF